MGWLDRLRRSPRDDDDLAPGDGISLRRSQAVELGKVRDLPLLLGVMAETLPNDAVLCVEGTSIAPAVQQFLDAQSVEPTSEVTRGTAWPASRVFHLRGTPENLSALRELALGHAEPEICDHLVVYSGDRVLVSAYDAGGGTVFVHGSLGASAIARLREVVG